MFSVKISSKDKRPLLILCLEAAKENATTISQKVLLDQLLNWKPTFLYDQ